MLKVPTEDLHGYSIKFSPFTPHKFAVAACQQYGISGAGGLLIYNFNYEGAQLPVLAAQTNWKDGLFDVAWSELNENICITTSGDGSLQVWDQINPVDPVIVLPEHQKEVYSVDWSHRGGKNLVVSASWDGTCKLFDAVHPNFKCISSFSGHQGVVYSAVWSPQLDDTFASASADGTVCIWDARNNQSAQNVIPAHETEILTCDWSKYDPYTLITGSVDCSIRSWDVRNPRVYLKQMLGHNYAVRRVKSSPFNPGVVVSCSYDSTVRIWDMMKPATFSPLLETIDQHSEFVYGLDLSTFVRGLIGDCSWDRSVGLLRPQTFLDASL